MYLKANNGCVARPDPPMHTRVRIYSDFQWGRGVDFLKLCITHHSQEWCKSYNCNVSTNMVIGGPYTISSVTGIHRA